MKNSDDDSATGRPPAWHDIPLVPPAMWAGYMLLATLCLIPLFLSDGVSVTTYITDFFYVLTHYWGRT